MDYQIQISKGSESLQIEVAIELDCKKSQLYVSEKRAEQKLVNVLNVAKKFSAFLGCSLYYDEIDYYDDEVDVYETPYFYYSKGKGKKKPTKSYNTHGSIPKDWQEVQTVRFKPTMTTIAPIQKTLECMGMSVSKDDLKGIRKVLQGKTRNYYRDSYSQN